MRKSIKVTFSVFFMLILTAAGGIGIRSAKADNANPITTFTPSPCPVQPGMVPGMDDPTALPDWINDGSWKTSGVYTYRILNEAAKEIEIRRIDTKEPTIIIPDNIDGYKVVRLGYDGLVTSDALFSDAIRYMKIMGIDIESFDVFREHLSLGTASETAEEIVIPDSVQTIGWYAFYDFKHIKKLNLPINSGGLKICTYAFFGCKELNNLFLPDNVSCDYEAFCDCDSLKHVYSKSIMYQGELIFQSLESWTVLKGTELFRLDNESYRTNRCPLKLYVLDKNTRVSTHIPPDENRSGRIELYTVKGGLSVKMAKKYHWTYHVFDSANSDKIKCSGNKKGGKYTWKWKKSKSFETTYSYNEKKDKWKSKKKSVNTQYLIYGKKKKTDKYVLLDCIRKTKYSCKYPYIKVKVNLEEMVQQSSY